MDSNLISAIVGAFSGLIGSYFAYKQKSNENKTDQQKFITEEIRKNKDDSVNYLQDRIKSLKEDTDEMKRQYQSQIYSLQEENARLKKENEAYHRKYGSIDIEEEFHK